MENSGFHIDSPAKNPDAQTQLIWRCSLVRFS
jgi:hypothetical protein